VANVSHVGIPGRWESKLALNVDEAATGNKETVVWLASAPARPENQGKDHILRSSPCLFLSLYFWADDDQWSEKLIAQLMTRQ